MSHRTVDRLRLPMVLGVVFLTVASSTSCSTSKHQSIPRPSDTTTTTVTVAYDRSCEKTAQSQMAMDLCAASELRQLQGQLASALLKERTNLSPGLVDAAQTTFDQYEVAECKADASPNTGGSIYPLVVGNCEVSLTVQRIEQVRSDSTPRP